MTIEKSGSLLQDQAEERKDVSSEVGSRLHNSSPENKIEHSKEFTEQDDAMLKSMGIAPASEKSSANKNPSNPWAGDIEAYERKPWNTTARGRLAIRMASRGILGAAFYAVGQVKGGRDMEGYDSSHSWSDIWHGAHLEGDMHGKTKWLQLLAKSFDSTVGNAVKGTVKFITGDEVKAAESVMFRPTRFYGIKNPGLTTSNKFALSGGQKYVWGRSLGAEIIGVTYDFACMSLGDGLAREYLIPMFDPAVEKKWLKKEVSHDDKGKEIVKTHLDFSEAGKSFAKAAWRLFTYNAGEDWFAGPLYVYYMKWQRNMLDKLSPGFGYDSDRALNGGSFKVNSEGKITGNYNTEGMLDLMGRFSFYNFLTLIFREGYNKIGDKVNNYFDTGKLEQHKTPESISDAVSEAYGTAYKATRYLVKSFIKAYTYMIPASFVFASIRTSQSKDIGLALHQETGTNGKLFSRGPLYFMHERDGRSFPSYIQANGSLRGTGKKLYNTYEPDTANMPQDVFLGLSASNQVSPDRIEVPNPFSFTRTHNGSLEKFAYNDQTTRRLDYATNLIGKGSHLYGDFYKAITTKVARTWNGNPTPAQLAGDPALAQRVERSYESAKSYTRRFSKASLSYTPYFFMKTDVLARAWDNSRVDMGLNRTIDGITNFNLGEFKAGISEWWHGLRNEPFDDPAREALVKKEIKQDVVRGDRTEDDVPVSQESMSIPSGYQYIPSVKARVSAPEPRGTFADRQQHARPLQDIIAQQQTKKSGNWSENVGKEQNAPSTTQIN